ncbi:unnamed protein product [Trifolium pratense]|uniref:Uncharacterized protein n=1 Tax=Trifolium pratense TaxID=57577 RepID=A0ACB0KJY2_TRIPR|nr:unnamed protein product [Trifolium pratense]
MGFVKGRCNSIFTGVLLWYYPPVPTANNLVFVLLFIAFQKTLDIFAPPKNHKSLLLPENRPVCVTKLPEDCHYELEVKICGGKFNFQMS